MWYWKREDGKMIEVPNIKVKISTKMGTIINNMKTSDIYIGQF